jgi:stalled ribosome alternative rescue factor ArfA
VASEAGDEVTSPQLASNVVPVLPVGHMMPSPVMTRAARRSTGSAFHDDPESMDEARGLLREQRIEVAMGEERHDELERKRLEKNQRRIEAYKREAAAKGAKQHATVELEGSMHGSMHGVVLL